MLPVPRRAATRRDRVNPAPGGGMQRSARPRRSPRRGPGTAGAMACWVPAPSRHGAVRIASSRRQRAGRQAAEGRRRASGPGGDAAWRARRRGVAAAGGHRLQGRRCPWHPAAAAARRRRGARRDRRGDAHDLPVRRRAGRGADAAGQAHGRPALARPAARQHRGLGGDPRAGARPGAGGMSASTPGQAARGPAARAAAVGALQAALAAEHAAVYGYGVAGAHLSGARRRAAARDWQIHESSRDALAAMITALGAQPVAAAAAYRLPFRVGSGRAAVSLAAFLEDRVATAYLGMVALSEARLRLLGARALESAALRAAGWRGRTLAFPGLEAPASGPVPSGPGAGQPAPSAPTQGPSNPGPSSPGPASQSPPPTGPAGA